MRFGQMFKLGFASEIEKLSARAGMKLIRKLVAEGTPEALAKAERLGADPRVLKAVAGGHQVKMLGGGAEGAAQLVAGYGGKASGGRGFAVKKIYDPNSPIASPELIRRKVQMSQEFSHPRLAKVYGSGQEGGRQVSLHEFAPGLSPTKSQLQAMRPEMESMLGQAKKKGWILGDVRGPNIVGGKVVDPVPFRKGEFRGQYKNMLDVTPKGMDVIGMGDRLGGARIGDLAREVVSPTGVAAQRAVRNVRKVRGARPQAGERAQKWVRPKPRGEPSPRKRPKKQPNVASAAIDPMQIGKRPKWVLPTAAGGAMLAGTGGLLYKARKDEQKRRQQGVKKVASSREEWAWNCGLQDELQKIASLTGRVLSQLARNEVMPVAGGVVDRAEERAARKMQALEHVMPLAHSMVS